MSGKVNLENTPRKRVVYRLCRCCNKFVPAPHHPYDLFGNKAKKTKIVELIVKYGEISIAINDGCSEKICQICFSKVNKIYKLVNEFRDACIESNAHQLSNCDRSKRCRCTQPGKDSPPPPARTQEILFHISKDSSIVKYTKAYHLEVKSSHCFCIQCQEESFAIQQSYIRRQRYEYDLHY